MSSLNICPFLSPWRATVRAVVHHYGRTVDAVRRSRELCPTSRALTIPAVRRRPCPGGIATVTVTAVDEPGAFLERTPQLAALREAFDALSPTGGGHLVFIGGEAGVGKTTCVQRFSDELHPSTRVLWGACDHLFTPRPLGAFLDVAQQVGGTLHELAAGGARPHEVAAALLDELGRQTPTVVVIEDVQWADEATLDVLRLVGPRIETVPALVLATYRDEMLEPGHPLQTLLGELATRRAISRLRIEPLSRAAVQQLADASGVDADELYRKTAGNPFFVTEALAVDDAEIPATVRDAVLARTAGLSDTARACIEAAAIVPHQLELWLLEALAGDAIDHLDECLFSGMLLEPEPGVIAFRHELARLAVEEAIVPNRRVGLHRAALAVLAAPPDGRPPLARLAHHAEAAGDAAAVLRFAPGAAGEAAALGAHREAAAQYARAVRHGNPETSKRADLLERRSYECYLTGQFDAAIDAQEQALACHRRLGDDLGEGDSLRSLSRLLRYVGRTDDAKTVGLAAVAVLERFEPGLALALAYCNVSHLAMNAEETAATVDWGTRALALAEELDELEPLVYALTNLGVIEHLAGLESGREKLERSLELAQAAGLEDHAGRAWVGLIWWAPRARDYETADRHLEAGLAYCTERGLEMWRLYLVASRARAQLDRGEWDAAVDSAEVVLRDPRSSPMPRIVALVVLGLVRARRGDPDSWPPLDEAWALAEGTSELQRIEPAAAGRAEAAWLEGAADQVMQATDAALELAVRCGAALVIGELAVWRWRAGASDPAIDGMDNVFAWQIAGEWSAAAERWTELGSPYEAALARADSGGEAPLRRALDDLQEMGARPAASLVARRLRALGVRRVPRGPRSTTRQNVANLTAREVDVLELVAAGLQNSEIAQRLFIADKTVDHHVSAILRKLDVSTRREAAMEAGRLGLAGKDR